MKHLILADDHNLFGAAVSLLLSQLDSEIEVTVANSVPHVLDLFDAGAHADLILLDYDMPIVDGVAGMDMIWERNPDQSIAIISGIAPPHTVKFAIEKGAKGWLQKNLQKEQLLHAIRMMASGAVYVPVEVLKAIDQIEERWGALTQAENGVVQLVAEGYSDKEVANHLSITPKTVQMLTCPPRLPHS